jgi:hypothetical protein
MGKKRKNKHQSNSGNMQKPYRRKKDDDFKKTVTIKGDIFNSDQIDPNSITLRISKDRMSIKDLDNLNDNLDYNYSGKATMFLGRSAYALHNVRLGTFNANTQKYEPINQDITSPANYLHNKLTVPIDFTDMSQFNQDALNGISSALGLPAHLINPIDLQSSLKFESYQRSILMPGAETKAPTNYGYIPPVYIDKDMDWFAIEHGGETLPELWFRYTEVEIASEYQEARRVWDPEGPRWLDRHMDFEEIGVAMHLHPKLVEAIGAIQNQDTINDILHKMRYLLYIGNHHILTRPSLIYNPTITMFQEYNVLVRDLAIAQDDPKTNKDDISEIEVAVEQLFLKSGLEHFEIQEKILGIAFAARNIMVVKKGRGPSQIDWPMVAMFDFDFTAYHPELRSAYLNMPNKTVDLLRKYPEEFFNEQITYLMSFIKNIVQGTNGFEITQLVFLNYKEWIVDVIRYLAQAHQYSQTKDQSILPIFHPIPMRFMMEFTDSNWSEGAESEFIDNLITAEIVDLQLLGKSGSKEKYIEYLWDGIASLELVREQPFRYELAPQLWDCTYYSSVLEPQWFMGFKQSKSNLSVSIRTNVVGMYMSLFQRTIISGQRRYGSGLGIARKEIEGDLDRLGWYVGFLKKRISKA